MPNKSNYEEQLANIMSRLADSVLDLSDEEIFTEARERGMDPDVEAERVRNVLRQASKAHRQKKLQEAKRAYERQVAGMRTRRYDLPASPMERRELLAAVFAAKPDIQSAMLTAQHRDFRELSDTDVETFLKQLKELGVLDS
jgi:hypothetical protein